MTPAVARAGFLPLPRVHVAANTPGAEGALSSPEAQGYVGALWRERRRFSRFEAFLDLRARAAFGDRIRAVDTPRGRLPVLERRGELVASLDELARAWDWTVKAVRCFLDGLESAGELEAKTREGWRLTGRTLVLTRYEAYALEAGAAGGEGVQVGHMGGQTPGHTQVVDEPAFMEAPGTPTGSLGADVKEEEREELAVSASRTRERESDPTDPPAAPVPSPSATPATTAPDIHAHLAAVELAEGAVRAMQVGLTVAVNKGAVKNPGVGERHLPFAWGGPNNELAASRVVQAGVERREAMVAAYALAKGVDPRKLHGGRIAGLGYFVPAIIQRAQAKAMAALAANATGLEEAGSAPAVAAGPAAPSDAQLAAQRAEERERIMAADFAQRARARAAARREPGVPVSLRELAEAAAAEVTARHGPALSVPAPGA